MSLLTTQGIRLLQVLVAATVVLSLFFTIGNFGTSVFTDDSTGRPAGKAKNGTPKANSFGSKPPPPKAANSTLDFQEIIYLSMPWRTDRQDALSITAAITGLKLKMIPGVKAEDMHPKGMPGHYGNNDMTNTPALGIWRAHANVWKYIIDNDIQSALIMEDDVDWDLNIKEIMGTLAWQLHYNNTIRWGKDNVQKGWEEDCPYGCDWDNIWVGQCGGKHNPDRPGLQHVFPEPHSAELSSQPEFVKRQFAQDFNLTESEGIRVVTPTWEPFCLMGYGVSQMGARRLLYNIGGWKPFGHPVDNEMAWRTSEGVLSGYTLTPPAFTTWRVGGAQDSDNDQGIAAQALNVEGPQNGVSHGMKTSVRRYLKEYFKKNYWEEMKDVWG